MTTGKFHAHYNLHSCVTLISHYSAGVNWRLVCWLRCAVCILCVVSISACNNDDLSKINDYYESRVANESPATTIVVDAQLSADQVASSTAVVSDNSATAYFTLNTYTGELSGEVSFTAGQNLIAQAVEIRRGHSGHNGPVVISLLPNSSNGNKWLMPDNSVLAPGDVDRLLSGAMYVLVSTANHVTGELRAQLLPGDQYLLLQTLEAQQVVDEDVNSSAQARGFLTVDVVTGTIQGSIRHSPEISPTTVSMHYGLAGLTGATILQLEPDPESSGVWNVPDNAVLSDSMLQQLDMSELYMQIASTSYPEGELRAQIYLPHYIVRTVNMLGSNLTQQGSITATGKAYVTINGTDGSIRAVIRLAGMTAQNVVLARITSSNNTGNRMLLYNLDQREGTWQLPAGALLDNNDFAAIGNKTLYFIATPLDLMSGEVAGIL